MTGLSATFGHGVEIGDVTARVGNRFAEDRARVVVDRGLDGVEIVEIDKGRTTSQTLESSG
jgi:hypothetical protein